mgnify:CR=1 FL=1
MDYLFRNYIGSDVNRVAQKVINRNTQGYGNIGKSFNTHIPAVFNKAHKIDWNINRFGKLFLGYPPSPPLTFLASDKPV